MSYIRDYRIFRRDFNRGSPFHRKTARNGFYSLQVVFIYGENFVFKLDPGFAIPLNMLEGSIQDVANPRGLGINLFAILLLVLSSKRILIDHDYP
jgi:hypothetical protein